MGVTGISSCETQVQLSKEQARRFLLAHHDLLPPRQLKGKQGILEFVGKVGCIQYDPLDMVGTNPNLVLQARIKDYRPSMLTELLYTDRKLLDGWDKNMALWRTSDWPFFDRYWRRARERYQGRQGVSEILAPIREALAARGPLSAAELDFDAKVDWAWAPTRAARAALESMYFWGELIVHHRVGTRKYYDFAAKYLPPDLLAAPDPNSDQQGYLDWHIKRRIAGVGLLWSRSGDAWLGIMGLNSQARSQALARLTARGEILPVTVEGISYPFFLRREEEPLLNQAIEGLPLGGQAAFLAPLDNMLWDRNLIRELFAFDYTWEVYKPASQRQYGYYVLPVLFADRLVARFEPRLDKQNRVLQIVNWWWEPGVRVTKGMEAAVNQAFAQFCSYLGAESVRF